MRFVTYILLSFIGLSALAQSSGTVGECRGAGNPNTHHPNMVADRDCLTYFDTTTTPFTRYEWIGGLWEIRLPEIDYTVDYVSIGQVADNGIKMGLNPSNGLILYVDIFGIFRYQGDVYNVRHFGAKGDGANDDTAAINAALLAAFIAGCKSVYFPAGVYRTSSVIDASCSGQKIFGDGNKSVIMPLSSWSASGGNAVIAAYGAIGNLYQGIQIKDIKIDASAYNSGTIQHGIELNYTERAKIENIDISGIDDTGIYLKNSTDCNVSQCYIEGAGTGVEITDNSKRIKVVENDFEASLSDPSLNFILCDGSGILDIFISDNEMVGYSHGVRIFNGANYQIDNNLIRVFNEGSSVRYGVFLKGFSNVANQDYSISGGRISSSIAAIHISSHVSFVSISGVEISGTTWGVEMPNGIVSTNRISISGCNINASRGVDFGSAEEISFSGNTVHMNPALGNSRVGSSFCKEVAITGGNIYGGNIYVGDDSVMSGVNYSPGAGTSYDIQLVGDNVNCNGNAIRDGRRILVHSDSTMVRNNALYGGGTVVNYGTNNDIDDNKTF